MKFFLDTADIKEIQEAQETGLLDGITTNPSHVAKANTNFTALVKQICEMVPGPVSAEVTAPGKDEMLRQGRFLADIAPNVVVKVPLTAEGIKAVKVFTDEGIKTNVTLCFSSVQALLAAKVGATYISPFIGRCGRHRHQRHGDDSTDSCNLRQLRLLHANPDRLDAFDFAYS